MIQANELRIGNFVKFNAFPLNVRMQIDEIDFEDILGGYFTDIDPIPLTEEWLIKFGFKQYNDFGVKFNTFDLMPLCGFAYDTDTKQVIIQEKRNSMSHWIERKIEYVHELQNLYFALRGQELTIKN